MQMQVTRLTNSINQRNVGEIEALLSHPLRQAGLGQYLASLPSSYGRVTGSAQDEHTSCFQDGVSASGVRALAGAGRPSGLYPSLGPDLPREVLRLEEFVGACAWQLGREDSPLGLASGGQGMSSILLSLNLVPWTLVCCLRAFAITVFVPRRTYKAPLNLELSWSESLGHLPPGGCPCGLGLSGR